MHVKLYGGYILLLSDLLAVFAIKHCSMTVTRYFGKMSLVCDYLNIYKNKFDCIIQARGNYLVMRCKGKKTYQITNAIV